MTTKQENQRRWRYRRDHNISYDYFLKLKEDQKGKCAICTTFMAKPHLDHCHRTGEIRGLLCGRCNAGLGFFRDNPFALTQAIGYLAKNNELGDQLYDLYLYNT